ncbi:ankyrin [Annulohypoxylon maeteangense]|uniref:ankyrin n=1 Tax=Annulohypoxylon maeteangense TaxID=1927788 RepID=UPI0020078FF2|nr:ankyrin [Annulohypoxylon maeteangense]KAI0887053.1 ankyrin [Annulohypoxylon maeteangense]
MADPLSIIASVTGVVTFAASTARSLISLIQEVADAPEEISHIRRDVQNLSVVLGSIQDIWARYDLKSEDLALVASLTEYLSLCQDSMQSIRVLLLPLAAKGSGRRSPLRMVGWVMKKGEIKALRERLQEGKASLNITILTLNGVLEGKGQDEIKSDVNKVYVKLVAELRNRDSGRRVRKRMEDDVASVSAFGGRRQSISGSTDVGFALNRYFDQLPESSTPESPQTSQVNPRISGETLLGPFSNEPTTLLEAVRVRNKDCVLRLISTGRSMVERTQDGQTALHFCAIYNDSEIASLLLDNGADINARDNQLRSPLNVAFSSEAMDVANLLLQRGCSLTGTIDMIFPLIQRTDEVPGLGTLLKTLAPKFNRSVKGPYLVHQAIESNDTQSLGLLLLAGFDPNVRNKYGLPPLYQAIIYQQKEAVRLLLNHGAKQDDYVPPEARDKFDENIRFYKRLVALLDTGGTPLVVAARVVRDAEITRILLEGGADPNFIFPSNNGVMLGGLGDEEYLQCAKAIIEHGADPHGGHGVLDPFYWANACTNLELIEFMLAHGADVNHRYRKESPTVLFFNTRWEQEDIVESLLRHGADINVKNNSGETVLDIARSQENLRLITMLEEVKARGNDQ